MERWRSKKPGRFADLTRRKRRIAALAEKVEAELRSIEIQAADELIQEGVPRLPLNGQLLYFGRAIQATATGQDGARMRRAFARIGLGDLVSPRPNIQGIKAHIRERLEAELPVERVVNRYVRWKEIRQLRCVVDGGKPPPDSLDSSSVRAELGSRGASERPTCQRRLAARRFLPTSTPAASK